MGRSRGLGHSKRWHSAAEEMWLKHNSIWGQSQAEPRFLFACLLKQHLVRLQRVESRAANNAGFHR